MLTVLSTGVLVAVQHAMCRDLEPHAPAGQAVRSQEFNRR
jgi:hypothetical protein